MGNSIRRVGLLNIHGVGKDQPFHHQLERKGFIHLSEREFKVTRSGRWSEKWTMSYTVGLSTSIFSLTRSGKDKGATGLLIQIFSVIPEQNGRFSRYGYELDVETVPKSDALIRTRSSNHVKASCSPAAFDHGRQIHGGRITETDFYLFGTEDIGGLIVLEKKKNIEEEEPHAVTLAHYFASSGRCIDDYLKIGVGLSVIVKIGATNGNLDITVEGPDDHSPAGLRFLFDKVMCSRIWKPTFCLHCAAKIHKELKITWQSDSESVPVAQRHHSSKKNLTTISEDISEDIFPKTVFVTKIPRRSRAKLIKDSDSLDSGFETALV